MVCLKSTRLQINALENTLNDGLGLECDARGRFFYAREIGLSLKKQRVRLVAEKSRGASACGGCNVLRSGYKDKDIFHQDIFLVNEDIVGGHPEDRDDCVGESK